MKGLAAALGEEAPNDLEIATENKYKLLILPLHSLPVPTLAAANSVAAEGVAAFAHKRATFLRSMRLTG